MTAVALLFSIYQVKPSPFCVSTNWTRRSTNRTSTASSASCNVSENSQFIIITHNKRTIG